MGVNLIKEVLDLAPADISSAELVVLMVLAENASDKTRQGWPGLDKLTRRCRLSPTGLRTVFQRLAARGLEVRVAVGTDRAGRPVYAHEGHQTVYRVPDFGPRGDATTSPPADATASPLNARGDATTSQRRRAHVTEATPPRRPSPHIPSSSPQAQRAQGSASAEPVGLPEPLRIIWDSLAATDPVATLDEARAVAALIVEKHRPKTTTYYRKIAEGGGFDAYLAEVRAAGADERRRNLVEQLRTAPPCEHGQPGGDTLRTATNEPLCPLCRRGLPQPEPAGDTDPRVAEMVTVYREDAIANGYTPTTADLVEVSQLATIAVSKGLVA